MGGILGDHIAHRNYAKHLARSSASGEARCLFGRLIFGLEVNKDVLAFLRCLGSFGTVGDIEFTAANINIFRMGEHHPSCLQASVRGVHTVLATAYYNNTAARTLTFWAVSLLEANISLNYTKCNAGL